ncbi:hypothetical protein BGZ98_003281 [Dissophora globulifera]|nr:hypothetical protein BGZ98_003281 [Dissophora globulifera]
MVIPESFLAVQQEQDEDTYEGQLVFPGPRRIDLSIGKSPRSETLSPYCQAMMIRACSNLDTLQWSMPTRIRSTVDAFMRTLAASPWTLLKLKNLDLLGVDFNDKDLAQLLGQMRQLESLEVSHTRFGRLSIEALLKRRVGIRRTRDGSGATYTLCDSVKSLRIDSCADATGVLIQTLLESCPKLEFFQGGKVTVSEIAQGKEWVCQGILDLSIYLEANEDYHSPEVSPEFLRKQRVVFARLGQLTKLQYLDLTNDTEATRTLDLRLSAGMGSLANLKDLDQLFCTNDYGQRMGVQERDWIVRNWPNFQGMHSLNIIY